MLGGSTADATTEHGQDEPEQRRVAVIGGGVAGLSAAHELAERGFPVTVFERRPHVGGKASSSEEHGLPSEHGFRFFPGFYYHVIETMKEIPAADGSGYVDKHLIELDKAVMADHDGRRITMPLPTHTAHPSLMDRMRGLRSFRKSMPTVLECVHFLATLARLATTCEERLEEQLEYQSWFEYVMPAYRRHQWSRRFERLCAVGLTRSFVATRAEEMNARTGGMILLQLLYDSCFGPPIRRAPDRALDGPTTKVWIDPWREHLRKLGVEFRLQCEALRLELAGEEICGLECQPLTPTGDAAGPTEVCEGFDSYILAVPCEVLQEIFAKSPELLEADRRLAGRLSGVYNLTTRWMNGIVIGLTGAVDPPLPKGHVLCLSSQWALTLVDQSKFWSNEHLDDVRKRWQTLLSVDISDWDQPGRGGLPAKWPPERDDLVRDLWSQLQSHLPELRDHEPANYNLDFDIQYGSPSGAIASQRTNHEPLLINTPGSWANRPAATTTLPNLFIAGDFARTNTNFASMEAANEAAREAVNAVLLRVGRADLCPIEPLQDPRVWWFRGPQGAGRFVDRIIYRSKLPLRPPFRLPIAAWLVLALADKLWRTVSPTGRRRRRGGPA